MEASAILKQRLLWTKLSVKQQDIIEEIRAVAETLGAQVSRLLPSFTDHSLRHMDALWAVAEAVLTAAEIESMTSAEAFVLCASFYVHDLGMALAATEQGIAELRASDSYAAHLKRAIQSWRLAQTSAD